MEGRRLETDPVDGQKRQAVCHGMAALNGDPGVALAPLLRRTVGRVPSDGGRVDQKIGSGQGHQAGALGIPLIPTDQDPEGPDRGLDRVEPQVARREIEFFVKTGIVGDVHLSVDTGRGAVLFEDHGGVVVEAGGTAFEERGHDDHLQLAGQAGNGATAGAGDRLGHIEQARVLDLAEVRAGMQLLQDHQERPVGRGPPDHGKGPVQGRPSIALATLLDQSRP